MLKFGIIGEVKPGFARVIFHDEDDLLTDWLPVLVRKSFDDKESWQLTVKEQVAVMMDDTFETGVILGAIYSGSEGPDGQEGAGKFRKVFRDGSVIEFNANTGDLAASITGKCTVTAAGGIKAETTAQIEGKAGISATIEAPVINLTGNVAVSGSLSAASIATTGGGTISAPGGTIEAADVKAGTVSLKDHKHGGVQTGGGLTGTPV